MEGLRKIGHAFIREIALDAFYKTEDEKYNKRENSWMGSNWKDYFYHRQDLGKCAEKLYCSMSGLVKNPSRSTFQQLKDIQHYIQSINTRWDLLYIDDVVAVIRYGKNEFGLPPELIEYEMLPDYESCTIQDLRSLKQVPDSLIAVPAVPGVTRKALTDEMSARMDKIEEKKAEIKKLEDEKRAELDRLKAELEQKYREKTAIIEQAQKALEEEKNKLEKQLFLFDTELYSIRCFLGETVDFVRLISGKNSDGEEPVVMYQKIRYLDEEMGRYMAIYDFDGNDCQLFEDILKHREDLRNLFAPEGKSVTLLRVSKNRVQYGQDPNIANVLKSYETYHGSQIAILVRNGENLYIGWTDKDRISISDENVFYVPKKQEVSDAPLSRESTKEERASRMFVFAILQGIAEKLLGLPNHVSVTQPSEYVVLSAADGWISDNRFGSFADIVEATNAPVKEGDMVLTTIGIVRDDMYNRVYNGHSTVYEPYNNVRGRGEKNRTYDARIKDCTVQKISCIDNEHEYKVHSRRYRATIHEETSDSEFDKELGVKVTSKHITYEKTQEYVKDVSRSFKLINGSFEGTNGEKRLHPAKMSDDEILKEYQVYLKEYCGRSPEECFRLCSVTGPDEAFYEVPYKAELTSVERKIYISAEKGSSYRHKKSYANLQVFEDEYLNLTYLTSVHLEYVLINRNIGGWRRGNARVDFANSIKYLQTALSYLRKREKEEASILRKYMELYPQWQVDVAAWRKEHGYHILTENRAKRFAKLKKG